MLLLFWDVFFQYLWPCIDEFRIFLFFKQIPVSFSCAFLGGPLTDGIFWPFCCSAGSRTGAAGYQARDADECSEESEAFFFFFFFRWGVAPNSFL